MITNFKISYKNQFHCNLTLTERDRQLKKITKNIEFTKEQYKTLLKLMYCGKWVLNSFKSSEDKVYKETDMFEQFIFSSAKEFKLEKWIEYDEELISIFQQH